MNIAKQVLVPNSLYFNCEYEDYRSTAIGLHRDQSYGIYPYAYHLSLVEFYLINAGYDDYCYRASAWLHDSIEDTDYSVERASAFFGNEVAQMIWACTGVGNNREERNQSIYDKLKLFPKAAPVKVADRLANMVFSIQTKSDMANKYLKEFKGFSENIRPLMTNNTQDALFWNRLEDVIVMVATA